jgi:hypothetical protein
MRLFATSLSIFWLAAVPALAAPPAGLSGDAATNSDKREANAMARRHFLFDDDYTPESYLRAHETEGHGSVDRTECSKVPVRLKRSDGVIITRRMNRCAD